MENPWHRLPHEPEYVLPEDTDALVEARHRDLLHLDLIPEPFMGRQDAPVVILGNNPGIINAERKALRLEALRQNPAYRERMRNNLLHRLSERYPFVYLDPNLGITSTGWWERKLKSLFDELEPDKGLARAKLAKSILAIELFPYVSHTFKHEKLVLPSQEYSFWLLRKAIEREAFIILTRGVRRWHKRVKELNGYYRLITLKQVQSAPISPGNFDKPELFSPVVRAINDFTA